LICGWKVCPRITKLFESRGVLLASRIVDPENLNRFHARGVPQAIVRLLDKRFADVLFRHIDIQD
jgi:hypothetical protein